MDCSSSGSSVHEVLQTRTLECVALPSFRGSSQPRGQTRVSCLLHWQADSLPPAPPGKPNIVGQSVSSVAQSCLTLYDPMNCSMPGFPVHHQLLEFTQTHVHQVIDGDSIQPSHPQPFSSCLQSLPASGSFQMSQLFASGGQSIGLSASASVLPMNNQG